MKQIISTVGLLVFTSFAGASCPDVSGKFAGSCVEPGGRTVIYRYEISQNACSSVNVKVPMFRDEILIDTQFSEPVMYADGAFTQTKAGYTKTGLITQVRMVSATGADILDTTELVKSSENGIDYLEFTQKLTGAIRFAVQCRIPAAL